jgi:inner membrane protein
MDTTTHALAGYVIAKTGIGQDTGRWGTIAGVSAAILPDVDLLLGFLGTEFSLKYHRSLTNSLFLIIPLSLILAWLFVEISKRRRFRVFFAIAVVELLAHSFLDLVTSYGTMVLSPFSNYRFALDWVFIFDLFLVSTLLLPQVGLYFWKRKSQTLARVSVGLATIYIALCGYNHSRSLSLAKGYVREAGLVATKVASLPQPFSPFRWGNYILTEEKIYQGFVDLIRVNEKRLPRGGNRWTRFFGRYQPVSRLQYAKIKRFDDSPWVERALQLKGVKTFYWFARFPIARDNGIVNGSRRVEFFDLRFGLVDGMRRPFLYVVDFDKEGEVAFQGFL